MNYIDNPGVFYTYNPKKNSSFFLTSLFGFNYYTENNLSVSFSYKNIVGNKSEYSNVFKFGFQFLPKQETKYEINLEGSKDLEVGFGFEKKLRSFHLNFNLKQSMDEKLNQKAEINLSKQF